MAKGKWISYLRVSTGRQGKSLERRRKAIDDFLKGGNWHLVKEFVEVESGKRTDRPELAKALQACRLYGATLVIAKLDRLSRDAHFLLGLEKAGVDFVATDMPRANRLTVGIMAMVAEEERRMISERTKAALVAAKRRCVKLGGYRANAGLTAQARKAGHAQRSHLGPIVLRGGFSASHRGATGVRRNFIAGYCRRTQRSRHPDSTRSRMKRSR
jgi:DNA invertase Pin-like site-specific DNA recombinase